MLQQAYGDGNETDLRQAYMTVTEATEHQLQWMKQMSSVCDSGWRKRRAAQGGHFEGNIA